MRIALPCPTRWVRLAEDGAWRGVLSSGQPRGLKLWKVRESLAGGCLATVLSIPSGWCRHPPGNSRLGLPLSVTASGMEAPAPRRDPAWQGVALGIDLEARGLPG